VTRQLELTKREYIDKLKKELSTFEVRYTKILNENAMIGEDFRSTALRHCYKIREQLEENTLLKEEVEQLKRTKQANAVALVDQETRIEQLQMFYEELLVRADGVVYNKEKLQI